MAIKSETLDELLKGAGGTKEILGAALSLLLAVYGQCIADEARKGSC